MSTIRNPVGPQPPKVYWRRRVAVLLGLVAVIVVVLLIVFRPGSSEGASGPTDAPDTAASDEAGAPPDVPATSIPTEPVSVDGEPCKPANVKVDAITDKDQYSAGEMPQLSLTVTNTGTNVCVLNAGTKVQVFTITSGDEQYWASTDCQADPVDTQVSLEPGTPISSSVPLVWDRTRSTPDSCDAERDPVPADGASYHLAVSIDGIEAAETKQFLLY